MAAVNKASRDAGGTVIPIEPGVIARITQGIKYMVSGTRPNDWFGPGAPMETVAPDDVKGRQFDYPFAINATTQTNDRRRALGFETLRQLADSFDVLRLIIENRKDKLCSLPFVIKPRDPDKAIDDDPRCAAIQEFLQRPSPEYDWGSWLRMLLEDAMVLDAATIYPRATNGGGLFALEPVDTATIKRLVGYDGRTPLAGPAYQQVLKGLPAVDFTADELLYLMRNPRTNRIYGYSKVEQIIVTVNIALRRQSFVLDYYTHGSMPDSIMTVPEAWTGEQIKVFQEYFDGLMSGEGAQRRRMRFLPKGDFKQTKEPDLKNEFDEWLARVCCFAFGVAPGAFVAQVNRATAETQKEAAEEEGIVPWMQFIRSMMNLLLVRCWNAPDLEFAFDTPKDVDVKTRAEVDDKAIRNGTMTINEVRNARGQDPIEGGDKAFIVVGNSAILVSDIEAVSEKNKTPTPAPMLPGAQPGDEHGQPPKPGDPKQPPKPGDQAEKVQRLPGLAKTRVPKIDRDRPSVRRLAAKLQTAVGKVLTAQGKASAAEVVSQLGDLGKADSEDGVKLTFDELTRLVDEAGPLIESITVDGAQAGLTQVSASVSADALSLARTGAETFAEARAAELVKLVTDATRDKLRSIIKQAIEKGSSADELKQDILDSYAFSPERAEMIARTELATADVQGNLEGWKASGVVSGKEWLTADDDLVSDDCVACADAGVIPLDATFPGGSKGPPNHPNCRCDVAPVLSTEDDAEKSLPGLRLTVPVSIHLPVQPARTVEKTVTERDAQGLIKTTVEREI